MPTIIGIDVSKSSSSYHVLSSTNGEGFKGSFSMDAAGFTSLLDRTKTLSNPRFIMESTGRYHITLANHLLQHDHVPFIVNPVLVKQFSKTVTLRKTKTDAVDAYTIAYFGLQHPKALAHAGRPMDDERLSIARRREQVAEDIATAKTQLKGDLAVAFPEVLDLDVFTLSMLTVLSRFPSPSSILEASPEEIQSSLRGGRGRLSSVTIQTLKSLAASSVGVPSHAPLVADSAKHILILEERNKMLTKHLVELVRITQEPELEILTSIRGIGETSAAHFLAEIGDISRFPRYQNLIAFCGTDPGIYQSGSSFKSGRITKRGSASLRKYLYLMAQSTCNYNPYFKAYYDKKKAEGFSHRKAMVALMNKLIRTIFALLTKKEKFIMPSM